MGLRTQLKNMVKRALGMRDRTASQAVAPVPKPVSVSKPVEAPPPKVEAPPPKVLEAPPPKVVEAPPPKVEAPPPQVVEMPAPEVAEAPAPKKAARKGASSAGGRGIPETCPKCGAPSSGNWTREAGQFVCGSCGQPYT